MLYRQNLISLKNRNSGFTLVELTVVVFLLALISFIVFPKFGSSVSEYRFRSGVNGLVGLIRDIRNRAAITKIGFHLNFDIDTNEYWVTKNEGGEYVIDDTFFSDKRKLNEYIQLIDILVPELGKVAEGEVFIRFFPTGYVDYSIIHLENFYNPDSVYSILIKPLLGKVKIETGYVERAYTVN